MCEFNRNVFTVKKEEIDNPETGYSGIPSLVTYQNRINDIGFNGLTVKESRLFMTVIAGMYEKGLTEQCFSYKELKTIMHEDPHMTRKEFTERIRQTAKKLASTCVELISDRGKWEVFNLFLRFAGDEETGVMTVETNPYFASLLNNVKIQYTQFCLEDYNSFGSKHSQTLYRKISQFKNIKEKKCYITVNDLRRVFGISNGTEVKYILRDILRPAIKEVHKIKEFQYLRLDEERMRCQKPISIYYFRWDKPKIK